MAISYKKLIIKGFRSIQTNRGNIIFRNIFIEPHSQEDIKEKLKEFYHKNKKRIDNQILSNLISNYLLAFEELKYIDKKRLRNPNSKSKYHPTTNYYLANFNPVFEYLKEKNNPLLDSEKEYFNFLLLNDNLRKLILKEYPEEDLIQAVLKFYVKNCINKYFFYLRDLRENTQKYKNEIEKANEMKNPTTEAQKNLLEFYKKSIKKANKKYSSEKLKIKDFDIIRIIAFNQYDKDSTNQLNYLFYQYIKEIEINPEIVKATDNKILNVLVLMPLI